MLKIVTIDPVMTRGSKRGNTIIPPQVTPYTAQITLGTLGESITVECRVDKWIDGKIGAVHFNKTFKVGDKCIYDNFNLYYTGTITKISEKAISIWTGWYKCGDGDRTSRPTEKKEIRRLNIYAFCWRNYNFDAAETETRNNEISRYI